MKARSISFSPSKEQQIAILTQPLGKVEKDQVSGVIFQKHKRVHDGQMSGPLGSGQGAIGAG